MSTLVENYVSTINSLPTGDIEPLLRSVYAEDIRFSDPAHSIQGLDKLIDYFTKLYTNTESCTFTLQDVVAEKNTYALQWSMQLAHSSLKQGTPIIVKGSSFLTYTNEDKIISHQDYFDLGAMLYENVPLIGRVIHYIKGKL